RRRETEMATSGLREWCSPAFCQASEYIVSPDWNQAGQAFACTLVPQPAAQVVSARRESYEGCPDRGVPGRRRPKDIALPSGRSLHKPRPSVDVEIVFLSWRVLKIPSNIQRIHSRFARQGVGKHCIPMSGLIVYCRCGKLVRR